LRRQLRAKTPALLLLISASSASFAQPGAAPPADGCGEVITIETHDRTPT